MSREGEDTKIRFKFALPEVNKQLKQLVKRCSNIDIDIDLCNAGNCECVRGALSKRIEEICASFRPLHAYYVTIIQPTRRVDIKDILKQNMKNIRKFYREGIRMANISEIKAVGVIDKLVINMEGELKVCFHAHLYIETKDKKDEIEDKLKEIFGNNVGSEVYVEHMVLAKVNGSYLLKNIPHYRRANDRGELMGRKRLVWHKDILALLGKYKCKYPINNWIFTVGGIRL